MNISKIVDHMRQYCPSFLEVTASSDVETIIQRTNLPLPFAAVNFLSYDAGDESPIQNTYWQEVQESFEVIVVLDNSPRNTITSGSQAQQITIDQIAKALWRTLLFWRMETKHSSRGLIFRGAHRITMDRARAYYRFVFCNTIQLSYEDGFQIDSEPLTEIDVNFSNLPPSSNTRVKF